ncbi:MAG TPA: transposase family protein [Pilimelia sp.]|nr:transposase family protein [Pilimelia sp.]
MLPDPRGRRGIRHRLPVVVTAAVCAVVAGSRSYTAIAEWFADLRPADCCVRAGYWRFDVKPILFRARACSLAHRC